MAISEMQKVQIFTHVGRLAELLHLLQAKTIIEISDIEEEFFSPAKTEDIQAPEVIELLNFFKNLFPETPDFIENFIAVKETLTRQQIDAIINNTKKLKHNFKKAQHLRQEFEDYKSTEKKINSEINKLELYKHFTLPLLKINKIKRLKFLFGIFSIADWFKKTEFSLSEIAEAVLDKDEQYIYVFYCYFPESEKDLKSALNSFNFMEVTLPEGKGDYANQLIIARKKLKTIQNNIEKITLEINDFYQNARRQFLVWSDYLLNEEKIRLYSENLLETKKVALITGWVVKSRYQELVEMSQLFSKDVFIQEAVQLVDDKPPVALQNTVTSSFEAVTMLYGIPNQQEYDPTPFLAPFFILFYGLCLSDAGYGLMLFLLARYLLFKYSKQLTGYGSKLLTLSSYCGLSTIMVGTLTGSYFGISLDSVPWADLKNLLLSWRILDPVKNPLPLLVLSVVLGIIQLYTGLLVRWSIDIKQKGHKEAWLASGLWVYFVSGLIIWPLFTKLLIIPVLAVLGKVVIYTGIIALVLTQGRHHKNPLQRLGSGLISLYRVTGFVGDILSYSRLFALGLVTSVLAMVINYLAAMAGGVPVIGFILMILILIFGHVFDFLINILGSFVHSARLQYVEYFSKFFEGGGKFFKPFNWQTKYINLE